MLFDKILSAVKLRTKPFGFFRYLNNTLCDACIYLSRKQCLLESQRNRRDSMDAVFQWLHFYELFDADLLKRHYSMKFIGSVDFVFNTVLRMIYRMGDLLVYVFRISRPTYFLFMRVSGNTNSDSVIVTYTKGKTREDLYSKSEKYRVIDLMVSNEKSLKGYEITDKGIVSRRTRWQVIWIKLRYSFVRSMTIEEVLVAGGLFRKWFLGVMEENRVVGVLVREGATPINRMVTECARGLGVETATVFTNTFVAESSPVYTGRLIVNSPLSSGRNEFAEFRRVILLNDNPYLPWRSIAFNRPKARIFGILPDMGTFGYLKKCRMDLCMLESLAGIKGVHSIVRPHPQEMTAKEAVKYYRALVEKFDNVEIDNSHSIEQFLEKVSVVITNSETSAVEQALLCMRPVILLREKDSPINDDTIQYANGMVCVCEDICDVSGAIKAFLDFNENSLKRHWVEFVEKLGFRVNEGMQMEEMIDRAFGSELETYRGRGE